jgi:hypothetical protein
LALVIKEMDAAFDRVAHEGLAGERLRATGLGDQLGDIDLAREAVHLIVPGHGRDRARPQGSGQFILPVDPSLGGQPPVAHGFGGARFANQRVKRARQEDQGNQHAPIEWGSRFLGRLGVLHGAARWRDWALAKAV